MLVLMFSLAGVPPLVGFFGKFWVLKAAVDAGYMSGWPCCGVIASVIGAFYYLRIVFYMYFGEESEGLDGSHVARALGHADGVGAIMVLGVINLFGVEGMAGSGGGGACPLASRARFRTAARQPLAGPRERPGSFWTKPTAPMPRPPGAPMRQAAPAWIMARRQTAARGRRGRAWSMPPGNFAATLVLSPTGPADEAALRSFTAALALRSALATGWCRRDYALKWPNDVLLNGGKVAGILLEGSGRGGRLDWLAVGIGVNLAAAPGADEVEQGALRPCRWPARPGQVVPPETLLDALAAGFRRLGCAAGGRGLRPDPRRVAGPRGPAGRARSPPAPAARPLTGRFETVDDRRPAGPDNAAGAPCHRRGRGILLT